MSEITLYLRCVCLLPSLTLRWDSFEKVSHEDIGNTPISFMLVKVCHIMSLFLGEGLPWLFFVGCFFQSPNKEEAS